MATEQSMSQVIMKAAIKATKAVIMAGREADKQVSNARPIHTMPRSCDLALRQPMFDWKTSDKYQKLCNFDIKVKNIFMTNNCNTQEGNGASIILHWLG